MRYYILKTFNIDVKFSPAYYAANNGAIERKHQDLKNSLRASLIEMGNTNRDQWMKALPWVLLGRRVAFQPSLDASSAQMVLGMSPRIPGQILGHPGPPLNNIQLKGLLNQLYRFHDRPAMPMSGKRETFDIDNTLDVTHVYVKVDNPQSLCPKFEGPYEVYSRPSRSQVEVKIGEFKDTRPRLLTFHWSSCKPANLREGAQVASRPKLGRPPGSVRLQSPSSTEAGRQPTTGPNNQSGQTGSSSASSGIDNTKINKNRTAEIQTSKQTRPNRSTRNANPAYVFAYA